MAAFATQEAPGADKPCQFHVDRRGRRPNPAEAGEADLCAPSISRMAKFNPETPHHDLPNVESAHQIVQPPYFLDMGTANSINCALLALLGTSRLK